MSDKEYVLDSLARLPESATLDDIADHVSILATIRQGEQAADAGRLVPHEEVKRRILEWQGLPPVRR